MIVFVDVEAMQKARRSEDRVGVIARISDADLLYDILLIHDHSI